MTTAVTEPIDDFEAAKAVFQQLRDLPRERQERVLRWVAEGLGLRPPVAASRSGEGSPEAPGAPPPSTVAAPSGAPSATSTDIKSFIATKKPSSDQQFATAVAYYYRFEAPPAQRREVINTEILQEAARLAGRKRLPRPLVTLNNAKRQGYLDSTNRGEFSINTVGENLVAMTLPAGAQTTSQRRAPNRGRRQPAASRPTKRG